MMEKAFHSAVIVGRFQTFHNGHKDMIDRALALAERVGVFIGSSEESGTEKNPFSFEFRKEILERIYGGAVEIYPLPDIGIGNVSGWGDYVIGEAEKHMGITPDLFVSGRESRRIDWLGSGKGQNIAELYVPKTIDISATAMRSFILSGDRSLWERYTDPHIFDLFGRMHELVLKARGNTETKSL
ncbi:MAG: adenylyltransferase/cytidyltransferase family protein [Lachnospiraceae bacterium]|nr:adenylyltransferase/cytidyltransferase family protein [Lachnospiraceae bacterium]